MRDEPEGGTVLVPIVYRASREVAVKSDRKDIALAGFLMTADEWSELDPQTRAEILAVALNKDEPCVVAALADVFSEPHLFAGSAR
jgi:hypothetical protein